MNWMFDRNVDDEQTFDWRIGAQRKGKRLTLGEGYEHVEEMGVGWGVWSWATIGVNIMEGGKGPTFTWSKGFGKM
jgi:hypothetical protein